MRPGLPCIIKIMRLRLPCIINTKEHAVRTVMYNKDYAAQTAMLINKEKQTVNKKSTAFVFQNMLPEVI